MTSTRTAIEVLPYEQALRVADKALVPFLGRDIGNDTGWIFNGAVPYKTASGKLLYNLTIEPSEHLNEVEEAEKFHDTGIDATVDFLTTLGIVEVAHWVIKQDDDGLRERLLAL